MLDSESIASSSEPFTYYPSLEISSDFINSTPESSVKFVESSFSEGSAESSLSELGSIVSSSEQITYYSSEELSEDSINQSSGNEGPESLSSPNSRNIASSSEGMSGIPPSRMPSSEKEPSILANISTEPSPSDLPLSTYNSAREPSGGTADYDNSMNEDPSSSSSIVTSSKNYVKTRRVKKSRTTRKLIPDIVNGY